MNKKTNIPHIDLIFFSFLKKKKRKKKEEEKVLSIYIFKILTDSFQLGWRRSRRKQKKIWLKLTFLPPISIPFISLRPKHTITLIVILSQHYTYIHNLCFLGLNIVLHQTKIQITFPKFGQLSFYSPKFNFCHYNPLSLFSYQIGYFRPFGLNIAVNVSKKIWKKISNYTSYIWPVVILVPWINKIINVYLFFLIH